MERGLGGWRGAGQAEDVAWSELLPQEQVWEAGGDLRSWTQVGFMGIVAIFVGNSGFKEQTGPWELEQGHGAAQP